MNTDETRPWGLPVVMRYLLFMYMIYLSGRVSFILIMGAPNHTVESSENFMKLPLIKKALSLIIGLPIYITLEIIPQWIASLLQYSKYLCMSIMQSLQRLLINILNMTIKYIKWIYKQSIHKLTLIWLNIIVPSFRYLKEHVIDPFIEFIHTKILIPFIKWLVLKIAHIWTFIEFLLDRIGSFIEFVWNKLCSIMEFIWNKLCSLMEFIWNKICSVVEFVSNRILIPSMKWLWSHFIICLNKIITFISSFLETIYDSASRLIQWIGQQFQLFYENIYPIFNFVWNRIVLPFADWIYELIQQLWSLITTCITRVLNVIGTYIRQLWSLITTCITRVLNVIGTYIQQLWSKIITSIKRLVYVVWTYIQQLWVLITTRIIQIFDLIKIYMTYIAECINHKIQIFILFLSDQLSILWGFLVQMWVWIYIPIRTWVILRLQQVYNLFNGLIWVQIKALAVQAYQIIIGVYYWLAFQTYQGLTYIWMLCGELMGIWNYIWLLCKECVNSLGETIYNAAIYIQEGWIYLTKRKFT